MSLAQQRCEMIFTDSDAVIDQLAKLYVDIENAPAGFVRSTLKKNYDTKLALAKKSQLELDTLNQRIQEHRGLQHENTEDKDKKRKETLDVENAIFATYQLDVRLEEEDMHSDLRFSPDHSLVSTTGRGGFRGLFNTSTGGKIHTLAIIGNGIDYSADKKYVLGRHYQKKYAFSLIDIQKNTVVKEFNVPYDEAEFNNSWAKLSGDGKILYVIASGKNKIQTTLLDTSSGQEISRRQQHTFPTTITDFSADGQYFAGYSREGGVIVYNTQTLVPVARWRNLVNTSVLFLSGDGNKILAKQSQGTITFGNVATKEIKHIPVGKYIHGLSNDGKIALLRESNNEEKMIVYDTENDRVLQEIKVGRNFSGAASLSPDGTRIVLGTFSGTSIWKKGTDP
jgi:WD40 repeat protein